MSSRSFFAQERSSSRIELPTLLLTVVIFGGWLAVTWHHAALPGWLLLPLGAWLIAWHGSLQHEAVHGHPTRSATLNAWIVGAPLGLWLPYSIYRESHLGHHRVEHLTDPTEDSESYYVTAAAWARAGALRRALLRWHSTLLGRVLLGPATAMLRFARAEWRARRAGDRSRVGTWALHLVACALVLAWVVGVCGMPIWRYVVFFVYPGLSLTLLRSFLEHRPARAAGHRSVVIESGPVMSLLYLNNNLHAVHHAAPHVAWYELPARYRARRREILEDNGGFFHAGYLSLFRRYALRRKDAPVHPGAGAESAR